MIINVHSGEKVDVCFKVLKQNDIQKYGLYKKNG